MPHPRQLSRPEQERVIRWCSRETQCLLRLRRLHAPIREYSSGTNNYCLCHFTHLLLRHRSSGTCAWRITYKPTEFNISYRGRHFFFFFLHSSLFFCYFFFHFTKQLSHRTSPIVNLISTQATSGSAVIHCLNKNHLSSLCCAPGVIHEYATKHNRYLQNLVAEAPWKRHGQLTETDRVPMLIMHVPYGSI